MRLLITHTARLRRGIAGVCAAFRECAVPLALTAAVVVAPPDKTEAVATLAAVPLGIWCARRYRR